MNNNSTPPAADASMQRLLEEVYRVEGVQVVIPENYSGTVRPYPYQRAARGTTTAGKFVRERLGHCLDSTLGVRVLSGEERPVVPNAPLQHVRMSYLGETQDAST